MQSDKMINNSKLEEIVEADFQRYIPVKPTLAMTTDVAVDNRLVSQGVRLEEYKVGINLWAKITVNPSKHGDANAKKYVIEQTRKVVHDMFYGELLRDLGGLLTCVKHQTDLPHDHLIVKNIEQMMEDISL